MAQEKTGRKNVRGLIIFLIAIVVIALAGAITYFVIRPVGADTPSGYTLAKCSAELGDIPASRLGFDAYYRMLTRQNDQQNGLTKTFYAIDKLSRQWSVKINVRNTSSGISANQFRSNDKIGIDMEIQKINASSGQNTALADRFWVRVINKKTGKPFTLGSLSTTNLKSYQEFAIPTDFTGDIVIRFILNGGEFSCGPAFNVWPDGITVVARTTDTDGPNPTEASLSLTLRKGFNAVYLPSSVKHLFTSQLKSAGMTVWTFNQVGEKDWATTGAITEKLDHKLGYYIQNPGEQKTVNITLPITTAEESPHKIYPGWNLLANSSTSAMKLNQFRFIREFCPASGTCEAGVTQYLSDLSWGIEKEKKAYGIFIIADPYASEADKAFQFIDVNDTNKNTIEIPAGKLFWVYVWPS